MKVFNLTDKHSHQKQYGVRPYSAKISNGSIKAFSKALWKCTASGQSIAVGPFKTYNQAQDALKLYKMVNDTITPRATNQNRAWFLVKVNITERAHAYQFERMAARVWQKARKKSSATCSARVSHSKPWQSVLLPKASTPKRPKLSIVLKNN